jgi:hypothetical protein
VVIVDKWTVDRAFMLSTVALLGGEMPLISAAIFRVIAACSCSTIRCNQLVELTTLGVNSQM